MSSGDDRCSATGVMSPPVSLFALRMALLPTSVQNTFSWKHKTQPSLSIEDICGRALFTGRHVVVDRLYLKHSESQWVSQPESVDDEGASTAALHIDTGEGVQLRVHPVESLVQQVWKKKLGWVGRWWVNRSDQFDSWDLHEWIRQRKPT